MKNIIIVTIALSACFASCKKSKLNNSELIGMWTEIQPCKDPGHCYTFNITETAIYVLAPFIDTGKYYLINNDSIMLDCSVLLGPYVTTSKGYRIAKNDTGFTIVKAFAFPPDSIGQPITVDLHLKK